MLEQFLWVEKYRPKTVEETILPADLKTTFQQFVDQKNIPNLILSDRKSTRLNSSHSQQSRMPSSA